MAVEIGALIAAGAAFVAYYWFVGFPIYNNATWLDPWYYTGLFVNFHFLHGTFTSAYYPTRLPWLIPGRAIFAVFPPTAAYLVLHIVAGATAVGSVYLLVRRFLGRAAGFVAAALVASSPLAYHALYRDYVNAGELTYMYVGMYLALGARAGRRPRLAMAGAGFFLSAAVATHFLSAVFIAGLVVPYAILFRPKATTTLLRDAACFIGGCAGLFMACGVYSVASGGPFNFLAPALASAGQLNLSGYRRHGVSWVLSDPWMLVPASAVATIVVLLAKRGAVPDSQMRAFAWAIAAYAALMSVAMVVWEVLGGMVIFEWLDYFELFFSVAVIPALAVAAGLIIGIGERRGLRGTGWFAALGVIVALVVPPLAIFRLDWTSFTGRAAFVPSAILIGATVLLAAFATFTQRSKLQRSVAAVVAATCVGLAAAYPVTASTDVMSNMNYSRTLNQTDSGVFRAGIDWVRWMESNGFQTPQMATWYDGKTSPEFAGVASLYFYGWILLDTQMPKITTQFRALWTQRKPTEVVLLCSSASCEGAQATLAQAGYAVRLRAARLFSSGPVRLWVRVLTVGAS
ncbi:MAG: glycosyltransferase family 39 protein [Gaiellaceae bacterium]